MAILSDKEILDFINQNQLIINADINGVKSSSYDMRVGTIFRDGQIINGQHSKGQDPVIVKPGEVVTMLTLEDLTLPNNIAATAYAMNSQSLDGFLVLNPGHIDPGYKGTLSIKALNLRKVDLPLSVNESIFTVVFQKLENDVSKPYTSNKTRRQRELEVSKNEIEKSMKSIADLMSFTPEDIDERISKHNTTILNNRLAAAAAIFSILATILAGLQIFKSPDIQTPKPVIESSMKPLQSSSSISASLNQKQDAYKANANSVKKN